MIKHPPSKSVNQDLDSPSDEALHLEINKDELKPLTEPSFKAHRWVQKGPFLICKSCPLEHGTYIGTSNLFLGIDEKGLPILKKVEIRK